MYTYEYLDHPDDGPTWPIADERSECIGVAQSELAARLIVDALNEHAERVAKGSAQRMLEAASRFFIGSMDLADAWDNDLVSDPLDSSGRPLLTMSFDEWAGDFFGAIIDKLTHR